MIKQARMMRNSVVELGYDNALVAAGGGNEVSLIARTYSWERFYWNLEHKGEKAKIRRWPWLSHFPIIPATTTLFLFCFVWALAAHPIRAEWLNLAQIFSRWNKAVLLHFYRTNGTNDTSTFTYHSGSFAWIFLWPILKSIQIWRYFILDSSHKRYGFAVRRTRNQWSIPTFTTTVSDPDRETSMCWFLVCFRKHDTFINSWKSCTARTLATQLRNRSNHARRKSIVEGHQLGLE